MSNGTGNGKMQADRWAGVQTHERCVAWAGSFLLRELRLDSLRELRLEVVRKAFHVGVVGVGLEVGWEP
jgi:hypothetical protein